MSKSKIKLSALSIKKKKPQNKRLTVKKCKLNIKILKIFKLELKDIKFYTSFQA